jgi:malic enzyme
VAVAVAQMAIDGQVAPQPEDGQDLEQRVRSLMWQPTYQPIHPAQ